MRRAAERLGAVAQSVKLLDRPSLEALEAQHAALQDGLLASLLAREGSFDVHRAVCVTQGC